MRLGSLLHSLVLCAASAADAAPLPEAGDAALVSAEFRAAAARSRGPRSGDIYTLPRPYNYVVDPPYAAPERSTLSDEGRPLSRGRPLLEALLPQSQPPRAILTLAID